MGIKLNGQQGVMLKVQNKCVQGTLVWPNALTFDFRSISKFDPFFIVLRDDEFIITYFM